MISFSSNPQLFFASASLKAEEKEDLLSIDYLKNLPNEEYIIGPGDYLLVIVSRDYPELTTTVEVNGEGTISLPKLSKVYVEGLTVNELSRILDKAYIEYVKFPSVELDILGYRPIRVFIEGEVQNPGLITLAGALSSEKIPNKRKSIFEETLDREKLLKDNTNYNFINSINQYDKQLNFEQKRAVNNYFPRVFDLIRQSGGITQFADLSNIEIIRKNSISNGGGKITTNIDLERALLKGDNIQNIRIYDSDIIRVKRSEKPNRDIFTKAILSNINSRYLNVFVYGRVNKPGLITVSRVGVLSDAVDMAGGTKVIKGPVMFLRFNNDGSIDKRKFRYKNNAKRGSYRNPQLEEGDLVVVGASALSQANEIINELTSPFIGIFSTYSLIQAIQD